MAGSERLLNASEAAEFLGVSTSSVRKWSDQGLVPVYRTPGGQRRYSLTDLERFLESMREPPRSDLRAADMPPRARRPGSAKGG